LGAVIGIDAGNTKTELVAADLAGVPSAYLRGPGMNVHGLGAEACVAALGRLVDSTRLALPADCGVFFLCGVDVPADADELTNALAPTGWARRSIVDNDTFALLRAGSDASDAVAVVCGAGINCVGRAAGGRIARYPSLGWETGDWGGSEMLGREVLFHAARAEDGRGEPSVLAAIVRAHFGMSVAEVGEAVHYRRLRETLLGELAPQVVAAAADRDAVARALVERLAQEIVLMALRALADLELDTADVVLGGGMLRDGRGLLFDEVASRLGRAAPGARPVAAKDPPVLGAGLAALEAAGASAEAARTLRAAFRNGLTPAEVGAS
jgi:N-acetylglucosamine kinase-like BadF-type ATPase